MPRNVTCMKERINICLHCRKVIIYWDDRIGWEHIRPHGEMNLGKCCSLFPVMNWKKATPADGCVVLHGEEKCES